MLRHLHERYRQLILRRSIAASPPRRRACSEELIDERAESREDPTEPSSSSVDENVASGKRGGSAMRSHSTHDELRDRIALEYFGLPPLSCRFCHSRTLLPKEGVSHVVTEHRHQSFRADVASLDKSGRIVAVVEIVSTNPPSDQVLSAQSELESAFYVTLDALDDGFSGFCTPICWTHRGEENTCSWSAPSCPRCERYLHELEFPHSLIDWLSPTGSNQTNPSAWSALTKHQWTVALTQRTCPRRSG